MDNKSEIEPIMLDIVEIFILIMGVYFKHTGLVVTSLVIPIVFFVCQWILESVFDYKCPLLLSSLVQIACISFSITYLCI